MNPLPRMQLQSPTQVSTESCIEMLRTLVAFPTVSRESNLELIAFVRSHLEALGAKTRLTYADDGQKANLFATLGPSDAAGVALSGHTDVVPVDGQAWITNPFELVEKDGRLFGRGTADMKSFIAVGLALAPEFVQRGLEKPLHFALSYDEEVGCIGVGRMIADLVAAGIKPHACIVGEPTEMHPVIAHKGKRAYRCHVRGVACHSAYAPQGVNAVEAAAEAVAFLKKMARRHRDSGPYDRSFDISHTTIHTGVLRGGTALNIVPHECVFDFEFRHLPGDDPDSLLGELTDYVHRTIEPEMRARDPDAGFTFSPLTVLPALDAHAESAVVGLAQELSLSAEIGKVSFGTEGSQYQAAGIPAVICGPGSIEQAHKPNEYVEVEQIEQCIAFMRRLMLRLCAT